VSSTSQLTDFSDLYTDLQNRVRIQTGVTATETQAKRYINIALQDMHLGFDYKVPWAERRAVLRTQDDYSTGTIVATRGSTTITGTTTAWNTNNDFGVKNMRANGRIVINGSQTPYTISAVGGDTTATLSTAFTETTVTDGTYVYYEDEYDLAADFLRPVDIQVFSDQMSIDLISRTEFRRRYPTNTIPGRPTVATLLDFAPSGNTTPIRRVKFAPPPNDFLIIPYAYITGNLAVSSVGVGAANLSAATDEPIVPLRYRHALVLHALYHWMRDKKDDTRSQEAKAEYTDIMTRISLDQEIGSARPQLRPRVSGYVRAAKSPYRGRSGRRYDTGGRFDRNE
jgi:hypothetical protein